MERPPWSGPRGAPTYKVAREVCCVHNNAVDNSWNAQLEDAFHQHDFKKKGVGGKNENNLNNLVEEKGEKGWEKALK